MSVQDKQRNNLVREKGKNFVNSTGGALCLNEFKMKYCLVQNGE